MTWAQKKMFTLEKRENITIYYVFERPLYEKHIIYYVFERSEMLLFSDFHENIAIYCVFHTFTM